MTLANEYMFGSRHCAARFVGRRLISADRLYRSTECVDAIPEDPRVDWGPLLAMADDGTGWYVDVDEGRSNILLYPLENAAVAARVSEYKVRTPAIDPAGRIGYLLREPLVGVDLIDRPSDPNYPHSLTMCGMRLRVASGRAVYLGTHMIGPGYPGTALLCADEVRPDLRCTPLAGAGADIGFARIEYEAGNENNPADPFGRTVLMIDGLGVARLDNTHVGRHQYWHAVINPAVLTRLTGNLLAAGFPEAPRLPYPAGSTPRHLTVSGTISGRVMLEWHGAARLPGYDDVFAVLDSLIHQISDGNLPVAPDVLPPSIVPVY